jgi:ribosome-associated toxin RatA of RatAB toxin-antitoxin module
MGYRFHRAPILGKSHILGLLRDMLLVALLSTNAFAATTAVDVASDAGSINIKASALLNSDARTAWDVLTDYAHYPDFIPGLRASRIVGRRGATVTVEQSGDFLFWLLPVSLDVTFEITEVAPTYLRSRVVAGDLHALDSRYVLTPGATGVRLEYSGVLDSGFPLFDPVERFAVRQNVARRFQALSDEIERRSASQAEHGRRADGNVP